MPSPIHPARRGIRRFGTSLSTSSETGANLRDLMDRMGHATTRAALIYLHKSAGRDRAIADGLSKMIEEARQTDDDPDDELPGDGVPSKPRGT